MWERTLQDLIRGLRANKEDEQRFIAKAVAEIRDEIRNDDMELKAAAVLKLIYLDMIGYDMNWASFHIVEVMSSPKPHLKSVGYLAAGQSFNEDTDVLMLTTNLLKKDLASTPADVAITLNGLSHFITFDLARDLAQELFGKLNHSHPHIRKRAVLAMHKVFTLYPEAAKSGMPRFKEKLQDPDPSVVAATINVLCELAKKNPEEYLSLAPQLFHLLTTSSNNWMLIKIIKLFGSLSPFEPRLVRKLQPPITELISTTPAISLLYECVHTCIIGGMLGSSSGDSLAKLCINKLAAFIQDPDQNLKYIALLAMVKIVPSHPWLVAEYQDTILSNINDVDISIRMRALDLVSAMASRDNVQSIVQQILSHLVDDSESTSNITASQTLSSYISPTPISAVPIVPPNKSASYRLVLSQRIIGICSHNLYEHITNFEWYLSVLVDLAHVSNADVGKLIKEQIVDVVGRVRSVRPYAVRLMKELVCDEAFLRNVTTGRKTESRCREVLWAAAWVCGEYCSELSDPQSLLAYLLQPPEILSLDSETIAVYVQAAVKIFGYWASEMADHWDDEELTHVKAVVDMVMTSLKVFSESDYGEVQERAANAYQLFTFIQHDLASYKPKPRSAPITTSVDSSITENGFRDSDPPEEDESFNNPFATESAGISSSPSPDTEPHFPKSLYLLQPLFSAYELNPVAAEAQASVPIPEGLDLDKWLVPPPPPPEPVEQQGEGVKVKKKSAKGKERESGKGKKKKKGLEYDERGGASSPGDVLTPVETEAEAAAEKEARERRKAERLERMKDDPYYIIEDKAPNAGSSSRNGANGDDIDSIPIVRLDDLPPLTPRETAPNTPPPLRSLHKLSSANVNNVTSSPHQTSPSLTPVTVDREGEMPQGAVRKPFPTSSINIGSGATPRSLPGSGAATPSSVVSSSFPRYDVGEDIDVPRSSTPQPIKVQRAKKKGAKGGSKTVKG